MLSQAILPPFDRTSPSTRVFGVGVDEAQLRKVLLRHGPRDSWGVSKKKELIAVVINLWLLVVISGVIVV